MEFDFIKFVKQLIKNQIYTFPLFTRLFCSVLFIFMLSGNHGFPQEIVYQIVLHNNPEGTEKFHDPRLKNISDSALLVREIKSEINVLRGEGYLLANLDAIKKTNDAMIFDVHIGRRYDLASLTFNGLPEEIEKKLKNKPKKYIFC